MKTAANEACTGWLHKNCYLMGKNGTFDRGRCKSIKGEFFSGAENE